MALGGARPGSGRKKGSLSRPSLGTYFSRDDILELAAYLKREYPKRPEIAKIVVEHIFGKAPQALDLTSQGERIKSLVDILLEYPHARREDKTGAGKVA